MNAATPTNPGDGVRVAIGLGSNLGDRAELLQRAAALLADGILRDTRLSAFIETAPVDCPADAGPYLNAAMVGTTLLAPRDLLAACLGVEQALGRPSRRGYHESRPMDVDILLYGTFQVYLPELTIPHPGMRERLFVLVPLAELAPDWLVPPGNLAVTDYLARLRGQGSELVPQGIVTTKGQPARPAGGDERLRPRGKRGLVSRRRLPPPPPGW